MEPELTEPVDLCLPDGTLNRAAVGWSRHPLQRCNLSGRWLRKKRWDFWGVICDTHLLRLTYASLDYFGLLTMGLLVFDTRQRFEQMQVVPFGRGMRFPERPGGTDIHCTTGNSRLAISETPESTRLVMECRSRAGRHLEADVLVARPAGHETLNVVIPWNDRCFQFTSKQNTRPATGAAVLDGATYSFGPANHAYGVLDYGRGVWPYRTTWNWGAANGTQNGRLIGLNLGGQWTDGTGATENGLCIDGRLHKISEDLEWRYDRSNWERRWHIRTPGSDRVALTFTPMIVESNHLNLLLLGTELHWALGRFSGAVVSDQGERIVIDALLGWAEEHCARW